MSHKKKSGVRADGRTQIEGQKYRSILLCKLPHFLLLVGAYLKGKFKLVPGFMLRKGAFIIGDESGTFLHKEATGPTDPRLGCQTVIRLLFFFIFFFNKASCF